MSNNGGNGKGKSRLTDAEIRATIAAKRRGRPRPPPKDDEFYWDGEDGELIQKTADDTGLPINGEHRFVARAFLNLHRRLSSLESPEDDGHEWIKSTLNIFFVWLMLLTCGTVLALTFAIVNLIKLMGMP